MHATASVITFCLIAFSFLRIYSLRPQASPTLREALDQLVSLPIWVWWPVAALAFTLQVFEYWITATSHPNALAGLLPWNDAAGYFLCSEAFLLNLPVSETCGKRPFYLVFFSDLLWLTGSRMQPALLLQALIVGAGCLVLVDGLRRDLPGQSAIAAYAVCLLFAAAFCASLVITENVGLLLGVLALAAFWRMADKPDPGLAALGTALLAAAVTVRPGPLFVLPALMCWYVLYTRERPMRRRVVGLVLLIGAILMGFGVSMIPSLVEGKSLGTTHSNFSYSLYGLAVGGKGWLQVTIDHPEIFSGAFTGKDQTDRIYAAAFESIRTNPHLFVIGSVKGVLAYFDDLFRYANEFKPVRYPLRFICLVLPWALGVWHAIRNWRDSRFGLLLWLQAGVIASSPFIAIDGYNRVFAATVGLDAIFVALGIGVITRYFCEQVTQHTPVSRPQGVLSLTAIGLSALLLPVLMPLTYRSAIPPAGLAAPKCAAGQVAVVVRPSLSALVLPLVQPGHETIFPLRVRADHFSMRLDAHIGSKEQFRQPAGTKLIMGTRIDKRGAGGAAYFTWAGREVIPANDAGFCLKPPSAGSFATAVSIVDYSKPSP